MSVVRIRDKKENYTPISNEVLNDKSLSFGALGVLVHLLSKPTDWKVITPALIRAGKNAKTQIHGLLEELQIAGYIAREACRTDTGRLCGYDYTVYEEPRAVDSTTLKGLVAQRDGRKHRRAANNQRHGSKNQSKHPNLDNPDTVSPVLDGRPPTKERGTERKEETKKTPYPADAGNDNPSLSFPAEDWDEGNVPTESPEGLPHAAEGTTDIPVASRPEVAADAAPIQSGFAAGVLGTQDPGFPHNGRHADWCA